MILQPFSCIIYNDINSEKSCDMDINVYRCVCACVRLHSCIVARSNSCKNAVLWRCGRLRGLISYILAIGPRNFANECW